MALVVTARDSVGRVGQYLNDAGLSRWNSNEIVSAMDQGLEDVYQAQKKSAQLYHIDSLDVDPGDFTRVRDMEFSYADLPITVATIMTIELVTSSSDGYRVPVQEGEIIDINTSYSAYQRKMPRWAFTGPGFPGEFTIAGVDIRKYTAVRIRYLRRFPELHFTDTTGAGITAGTTTTADLPADSLLFGSVVNVEDAYTGLKVLFEDTGEIRRITGFDAANRRITYTPATAAAAAGQYSLVVPMMPEHADYLALRTAYIMALRKGNVDYITLFRDQIQYEEARLRQALSGRSPVQPEHTYNEWW